MRAGRGPRRHFTTGMPYAREWPISSPITNMMPRSETSAPTAPGWAIKGGRWREAVIRRMRGGCMTCTGTCWNGAGIGMALIPRGVWWIHRGRLQAQAAPCAAATGFPTPFTAGQPTATATATRASGRVALVLGLCLRPVSHEPGLQQPPPNNPGRFGCRRRWIALVSGRSLIVTRDAPVFTRGLDLCAGIPHGMQAKRPTGVNERL